MGLSLKYLALRSFFLDTEGCKNFIMYLAPLQLLYLTLVFIVFFISFYMLLVYKTANISVDNGGDRI